MKIINRSPGEQPLEKEIFDLLAESEQQGRAKNYKGESLKAFINADMTVLENKFYEAKQTESMGGFWKGNIFTVGYKLPGKAATMIAMEIE